MKNISVELNGYDELFQDPDFNPFDPDCRCESGIADLYNQTQKISRKEALQIELKLPEEAAQAKTQKEVDPGCARYGLGFCDLDLAAAGRIPCDSIDLPPRGDHLPAGNRCWNHRLGGALAAA